MSVTGKTNVTAGTRSKNNKNNLGTVLDILHFFFFPFRIRNMIKLFSMNSPIKDSFIFCLLNKFCPFIYLFFGLFVEFANKIIHLRQSRNK